MFSAALPVRRQPYCALIDGLEQHVLTGAVLGAEAGGRQGLAGFLAERAAAGAR